MKDYDIDSELRFLKPLRLKKYTNFRRKFANAIVIFSMFFAKPKKGIKKRTFKIKGYHHQNIKVYFFEKKGSTEKKPAMLYVHGGGFQLEGTPVHIKIVTDMMVDTDYKAVYVKYRLTPKNPFPVALEDTYHALLWMCEHADYLNIDTNQLAIIGDSAGGNLAAAVSLLARDRKGPKIHKLMMFYPVLDCSLQTESMKIYDDTPMWNANLNRDMWKIYLKNGDLGMLSYASPLHAKLDHMPETYIETAEFDCLRDEGVLFANKLLEAKNKVYQFHTLRTVHGYDAAFFTDFVKNIKKNRNQFLRGEFK